MTHRIFLFLTLIVAFSAISQERVDGFEFEFKKVHEITSVWEIHSSPYVVTVDYDVNKKIQVRFRVKAKPNKRKDFNPNKFYLVVDDAKVKIRPIDLKHNYLMTGYVGFGYVTPDNKKHFQDSKDVFYDYDIPGYTNIETQINFGSEKKPNVKPIYFITKKLRSNIVDVYFVVPKNLKNATIYFGDRKLKELLFTKTE